MTYLYTILLAETPWPVPALIGALSFWALSYFLPEAVKFSYSKRLELLRRELLAKDKTAVISNLIVLAQRPNKTEKDVEEINRLMMDLCIYLPPCLVHKLAHTACNSDNKNLNLGWLGLLAEIRQYIDGSYKRMKEIKKVEGGNIPRMTLVNPLAVTPAAPISIKSGAKIRLTQEFEIL
jgi:hypothetical protein